MHDLNPAASYRLGDHIYLATPQADPYVVYGFSFREDWGRWTDGPHARIDFAHGESRGQLLVEIRIARSYCGDQGICDLIIEAGWGEPKLFTLGPDPARIAFLVAAEETSVPGTTRLTLLVARPKRPNEPPDGRALGIGVESFKVVSL